MKQETHQEAAERYAEQYRCPATNNNEYCKHDIISAFNNGYKFKKENRDIFTIEFALWISNNKYHQEHYYKYEHFEELLNEFKKNNNMKQTAVELLIEQIKSKADNIPTNTKENRIAKGIYVDCLLMARKAKEMEEAKRNYIRSADSFDLEAYEKI